MKLSFGNMTADFNIFHVSNQPKEDNENEEVQEVNLINSFIEDICTPSPFSEPLEACSNPSENTKENKEIEKFSTSQNPGPSTHTNKWQPHSKKLHQPSNRSFPSRIQAPNHELKPLLAKLKNAYLSLLHFLYYSLYIFYFLYYYL